MSISAVLETFVNLPHLRVAVTVICDLCASVLMSYFFSFAKLTKPSSEKLYQSPTLCIKLTLLLVVMTYTVAYHLEPLKIEAGLMGAFTILLANLPSMILGIGWSLRFGKHDFKPSLLALLYIASVLALTGAVLCGVQFSWK